MATVITIEVRRARPPQMATCRACGKRIEWVTTVPKLRLMPVDHPLVVLDTHEATNGDLLARIDGGQSHFATCPAADEFRRRRKAR